MDARPIARMRDDLGRHVDGLVEAAVAAGAVREDFTSSDVYAFLHMIGAVADRTEDIAPEAWRRYAEALLLGFGLERGPAAYTSAMTDGQILRTWPTAPAQPQGDAMQGQGKRQGKGQGEGEQGQA
jgi:hypothetical protein